jgi:hypothetical protein
MRTSAEMRTLKRPSSAAQPVMLKHVPERTCIACHEVRPKRDLVRLVYSPGGVAEVDTTGRKPGRGAYLCLSPECWHKGLNKGKLDHALRGKISAENRARLVRQGAVIRSAESASNPGGEVS